MDLEIGPIGVAMEARVSFERMRKEVFDESSACL